MFNNKKNNSYKKDTRKLFPISIKTELTTTIYIYLLHVKINHTLHYNYYDPH